MIRVLGWFCGVLLIANVVMYLWPGAAETAPHIHAPKRDVNPHFVRLNKEVEDNFYAAQSYSEVSAEPVRAQVQGDNCFRLGPFMHQSNFELAQAVLFNANVEFQQEVKESKTAEVFRVHLGPFATREDASTARGELREKGVLDHFARRQADGNYIVSLGIYMTRVSANRARSQFSDELDDVKLKQEVVVLPSTSWLHFSVDNRPDIQQQLERMDWGESAAKLGKYQCRVG